MKQVTTRSVSSIDRLAPSWRLSEAENKSDATLTSYGYATTQFSAFLKAKGMPTEVGSISREHVEAFLVDVMERTSPATAEARYRGLRQFFNWYEARAKYRSPRWPA